MSEKKDIRNFMELDARCCDELDWKDGKIVASYECWFDEDGYFGTETRNDRNKHVKFFTALDPETGHVSPVVQVETPEGITDVPFNFTPMEEGYFLGLMQACCRKTEQLNLRELHIMFDIFL